MWALDLLSDSTQLLLVSVIAFLIPYFILQWLRERNYPPGPTGLPIVGYLPFLGEEPHKTLYELSKKYGKIMSLYFGPSRVIVITDHKLAKEALTNSAALSRPEVLFLPGNGGIGASNGERWNEQRRFVVHTMKDLGLGRGAWENVIEEYAEDLIAEIKKCKGKPINYIDYLSLSQASSILALLIGRRLPNDRSHPEVQMLRRTNDAILEVFQPSSITVLAPSLIKYLIRVPFLKYYRWAKTFKEFEDLIKKEIDNHKKIKDKEGAEDFIGHFLEQMKKMENVDKSHHFHEIMLIGNVTGLFVAGTDTSASSLYWLLLFMATYPNIQKRVQEEIDSIISRDKRVYWDERNTLPYTMAAIMEMERYMAIAPLFPPRLATDTFTVGGYTIPKGSVISCNGWAIMRDPDHFKDPHSYNPDHFLSKDGNIIAKPESYIPFSIGKRNCPGETVALMSIFLYFVTIMQKFTIRTPDGKPGNFETRFSATIQPKYSQKLCFVER